MPRFSTETANRVGMAIPVLIALAAAAAALGAYAATAAHHRRPPFSLSVHRSHLTLPPGAIARYRITIHRHHFAGRIRLQVQGVPRYATARIRYVRHSRRRATLTIFTSLRTHKRQYQLRIRATHGRLHAALPVSLNVDPPRPASFTIAGDAIAALWPGIPVPVDLALANPNRSSISVTGLAVVVKSLTAPRATVHSPCSLEDFAVQQFTGSYPITVPGRTSQSLDLAGVARPLWPQVEIVNRAVDQDGCQGATITLSYTGRARTP
jgi:hypothetical protein